MERVSSLYIRIILTICLLSCPAAEIGCALSEKDLCRLYLEVVEDAVTFFEPIWADDSDRIPNSGFFDFRKYSNWMDEPYATIIIIPGNGMVSYCYSVLLTETDKETFTADHVPRSTLLDHALKAIRWCCLTSAYVDSPYPYLPNTRPEFLAGRHWRRKMSYRADEVGWLTLAAAKLWPFLDYETKQLVEAVMIGGAPKERLTQVWYFPQGGNHDQVKQDLSSTIGAAFLFPNRPDAEMYLDIVRGNAIDMVSTLQDFTNKTIADGKPIKDWARGWNLYQDYSSDHHGWGNIWYGGDMLFEGRSYVEILSALTGVSVPETFTYPGNGFDGVLEWLKVLCLPEGEPAWPHGNEYDGYYGAGLLAYCYGSTFKKDPVAAALEERAAQLLKRHSRATRMYDYHRNSWAKAATAFLLHKYAGPGAEPVSFRDAWQTLAGTYHYRWQQNLIHRSDDKLASFAWGSISSRRVDNPIQGSGLCGFVVPARLNVENPEPLIYCHPKSLIGQISLLGKDGQPIKRSPPESTYRFQRDDESLHTAGVVSDPALDRFYGFHSFSDGPCVMFTVFRARGNCRIRWSGLPVYFFVREGLTGKRLYYDAEGVHPLEEPTLRNSSWWCVNDTLGVYTAGGNATVRIERSIGYNWARQPEYKDKCDAVFVSPVDDKQMLAGEIGVDLACVFYPDTKHTQVKLLSMSAARDVLDLPEGWRGLVALDACIPGKRFLAIDHLYGSQEQTSITLSFVEGAPVLPCETYVFGKKAVVPLNLSAYESFGAVLELYVETSDGKPIIARRLADGVYYLRPVNNETVFLNVTYFGGKAESVRVTDSDGTLIARSTAPNPQEALSFEIAEPVFINLQGAKLRDAVAPAVEIPRVEVREDGRVTVEVLARDRSGIKNVSLYCDGDLLGTKSSVPYIWACRPQEGPHTFQATATDASPEKNVRTSFPRTVLVKPNG